MHIEPGVVDGAKMLLAYGTAAAAGGYSVKLLVDDFRDSAGTSLILRSALASIAVFVFSEVFPHFPVGISEVHFILGTTLLLLMGAGPAAVGLAGGLLVQGAFFAPGDLAMYFVNLTTLLMPLFLIDAASKRWIPSHLPYVDLGYVDILKLSLAYQGGVVAWVAFWAFYGQGVGAENLAAIGSFGAAYMLVVVVEPIADLAVFAGAKWLHAAGEHGFFTRRLHKPA